MILVQLYSRSFIRPRLRACSNRYAYGPLRVIYLGSSDVNAKGLHLSITVTLCRTGRDYFPKTWGEKNARSLPHQSQKSLSLPVIPSFQPSRLSVMRVLSRFGFKPVASLEQLPKKCIGTAGAARRLGQEPLHPALVALKEIFSSVAFFVVFAFSLLLVTAWLRPRCSV